MRVFLNLSIAIALCLAADIVVAQQRGDQEREDGASPAGEREMRRGPGQRGGQTRDAGGQRRGGGGGLFSLLDVDRDGQLSPKEIIGAVAVLSKLDVNRDGVLDANELAVRQSERGGDPARRGGGARPEKAGKKPTATNGD